LGTDHVWTGEGASQQLKEIEKKYIYVPILKVLENMMMCPAVCDEVCMYVCIDKVIISLSICGVPYN